MKPKKLTFMIVGNDRGNTKRWTLRTSHIRGVFAFSLILAVAFFAMTLDYFGLIAQSIENKQLRAENAILTQQFQYVENKLAALETGLERVQVLSTKLKLITNIEDGDRALKLAMGPLPKQGQAYEEMDTPMAQREPASIGHEGEDIFYPAEGTVPTQEGVLSKESSRNYATLSVRIDQTLKNSGLREQDLMDLWEQLSERQSLLNSTPSVSPVKGWFTSRFGYRISPFLGKPVMHDGIDIAAAEGTPVYAPADGVVTYAGFNAGYGNLVTVDHGYGVVTRYGHNSRIYVQAGQKVSRWDVIAAVGNTGRSTGPHLHYEVRINDIPIDPSNYILDR